MRTSRLRRGRATHVGSLLATLCVTALSLGALPVKYRCLGGGWLQVTRLCIWVFGRWACACTGMYVYMDKYVCVHGQVCMYVGRHVCLRVGMCGCSLCGDCHPAMLPREEHSKDHPILGRCPSVPSLERGSPKPSHPRRPPFSLLWETARGPLMPCGSDLNRAATTFLPALLHLHSSVSLLK